MAYCLHHKLFIIIYSILMRAFLNRGSYLHRMLLLRKYGYIDWNDDDPKLSINFQSILLSKLTNSKIPFYRIVKNMINNY